MPEQRKPHVVIVGAGFGGIKLAKTLGKENVEITLVDRHNFQLFQPLLYQVSTAVLSEDEMFDLLATDGMLVKRPLLIGDGVVLVGFREAEWETALA